MYKIYLLILLITISSFTKGQELIYYGEFGAFQSASAISLNQAGFIFVADAGSNEIIKLDTLGNIKKTIGGFGWSASAFDNPCNVFANTLNVYVADKNNDRIQIFDKDLNYLSEISSRKFINESIIFRYPTGVVVNSQGDLFILDSDNTRILKFNLRGEFLTEIGGYQSGSYVLTNPKSFTVNLSNHLLVLDDNDLIVFNQFGTLLNKIKLSDDFRKLNFSIDKVILIGKHRVNFFTEYIKEPYKYSSNLPQEKIIDAVSLNKKLYLLSEKKIFVYQIVN